jgi:hypothetical protein
MKSFKSLVLAVLTMLACVEGVRADWNSLHYGGYQPWWNIFAKRNRSMSAEEERLQRFWHDYYDAMRRDYQSLDRIDWVAYYKNHGYQINGGFGGCGPAGCNQRVQFAPVVVTPGMQWAVPNGSYCGAAGTPGGAVPGYPTYGAAPMTSMAPMAGMMPGGMMMPSGTMPGYNGN